jgi:isopentenyl diphosphate isomerase/L-lactate dehydrogenase-like FMN-dependent dehydrogenase
LALGAQAVQVGRGTLYGVAAGGEAGARRAIAIYREEIDRVLALLGCPNVTELGRQFLHIAPGTFHAAVHHKPNLRLIESGETTRIATGE